MSSDNPYGGQPGPYGQGGQGPPGGPYGYPQPDISLDQGGYVFGPFAPQPGEGPGPAGQPPGPLPGPAPQASDPQRRARTVVILGVVALALILVAVTTAVLLRRSKPLADPQPTSSAGSAGTASASPSKAPPAALASDAVTGYLNALAAGHASAALAYSADPVKPGPFLTDKVLAQSIKRAPITQIVVPEVTDQQATSVSASYRLGKAAVNTSYQVVKAPDGWKLATVSKNIDLGLVRSPTVPMLINGVQVNTDLVDLLPGSYAFTTASPHLTYGSKNVVVITDPNAYADVFSLRPALSDHGRRTVSRLADKSYDACLRTKVTRPRNCPFSWTNSVYQFRSGSVTWRQIGSDPFKKAKTSLYNPSAVVSIKLRVRISGPCRFSRTFGTCTGRVTGEGVASIRLDRKKLAVVWLR